MKKQIIAGGILMAACFLLTGCHLKHEWVEANCTEPKTCLIGGETEGEPLGHTWIKATCITPKTCSVCGETEGDPAGHIWEEANCLEPKTCSVCGETEGEPTGHIWEEANCTEPKTCSVCGETEGEPTGHTWKEANYQEPKICSICGETEGEPLKPAFEEHNLVLNLEEGVSHDFVTTVNYTQKTVTKLTLSNYKVVGADVAGREADEGYEWRTIHLKVLFDDKDSWIFDAGFSYTFADYYEKIDIGKKKVGL